MLVEENQVCTTVVTERPQQNVSKDCLADFLMGELAIPTEARHV